jgi:hypothetical protein
MIIRLPGVVEADPGEQHDDRHGGHGQGVVVAVESVQQQRGQFHVGQGGRDDHGHGGVADAGAGPAAVSVSAG